MNGILALKIRKWIDYVHGWFVLEWGIWWLICLLTSSLMIVGKMFFIYYINSSISYFILFSIYSETYEVIYSFNSIFTSSSILLDVSISLSVNSSLLFTLSSSYKHSLFSKFSLGRVDIFGF